MVKYVLVLEHWGKIEIHLFPKFGYIMVPKFKKWMNIIIFPIKFFLDVKDILC